VDDGGGPVLREEKQQQQQQQQQQPPPSKKAKVAAVEGGLDPEGGGESDTFSFTFECTTAFRTFSSVISELLQRAEFQVIRDKKDANKGTIKVESINSKQVCLVIAQLGCNMKAHGGGDPRFYVSTNDLIQCLRSIPHHYQVNVSMTSSNTVDMFASDPISTSHEMGYKLNTLLNDDPMPGRMNTLEYDYTLELDTSTLRRFVRTTKDLHGEDVCFRIEQQKHRSGRCAGEQAQGKTTQKQQHIVLTIEAEGTSVQLKETFHSIVSEREDGTNVIVCTDDQEEDQEFSPNALRSGGTDDTCGRKAEEFDLKYEDTFQASYIAQFLKHLDKNCVTVRMSTGKPLLLTYNLASHSDSFVTLVLAPKHMG